jgi:hypothetical protein
MIVIAIVVVLAIVVGVYLTLMHRPPETPQAPPTTNDPYSGQYKGGPAQPALPEGGPVAP